MPITQYRKLSYRSTGGIGLLGMNEAQRRVLGTVDTLVLEPVRKRLESLESFVILSSTPNRGGVDVDGSEPEELRTQGPSLSE
jgi:hypothetical protein